MTARDDAAGSSLARTGSGSQFQRDERIDRKDSKRSRQGECMPPGVSSETNAHQRSASRRERAQQAASRPKYRCSGALGRASSRTSLSRGEDAREPAPVVRGSRWIDYDTHELLEMISELEDERRWARLREGAAVGGSGAPGAAAGAVPAAAVHLGSAGGGQDRKAGQGRVHLYGHAADSAQG